MFNDVVIIAVYAVLAVFVITTTVFSWVQNVVKDLINSYIFLCMCTLGWLLSVIVFHLTSDPESAAYAETAPFVFIAFSPLALLIFSLRFYGTNGKIPRRNIILLSIIPFFTGCAAVIPQLNWMLRIKYTVISLSPLHVTSFSWNFWFFVHMAYSYMLMTASAVFIIRQHSRQLRSYSLHSMLMLLGIAVTLACNILTLTIPLKSGDFTLVGSSCSIVIFYFAIVSSPETEYLSAARNTLYSHIDLPVFILDRFDRVLDINLAAASFLDGLQYNISLPFEFEDMLSAVVKYGGHLRGDYNTDTNASVVIPHDGDNEVFSLTRKGVYDKKGQEIGCYIVMMDITQISSMIDELEYIAEIDSLTGIANRRAFETKCRQLDSDENLPLSFIVGDVNRLKYVNDKMGHRKGDELLKIIARILVQKCPEEGTPARIGGDEFAVVLPNSSTETAKKLVEDIEIQVKKEAFAYAQASIALGVVTKTRCQQNISDLLNLADREMYMQKRFERKRK